MATTTRSASRDASVKSSAADQIAAIASGFSLEPTPDDLHGPSLREQLLSSYIEWLSMEQRLASSELWPSMPEGRVELRPEAKPGVFHSLIPANTRWGRDFHFHRERWGDKRWTAYPHPLTRAALVLWAVGAIDDIPDPLSDLIDKFNAAEAAYGKFDDDSVGDEFHRTVLKPLFDQVRNETPAPTTMLGAAKGLVFALQEIEQDSEARSAIAVINAVIRFLKREEPRP